MGQAAKWMSVSNGHMSRAAWGRPGCKVGKCRQFLHMGRGFGLVESGACLAV